MKDRSKPTTDVPELASDALLACPCGKIPETLMYSEGETCKFAWVAGSCCGEWWIEFRTGYEQHGTLKFRDLGKDEWNKAPRAG